MVGPDIKSVSICWAGASSDVNWKSRADYVAASATSGFAIILQFKVEIALACFFSTTLALYQVNVTWT